MSRRAAKPKPRPRLPRGCDVCRRTGRRVLVWWTGQPSARVANEAVTRCTCERGQVYASMATTEALQDALRESGVHLMAVDPTPAERARMGGE